MPSKNNDYKSMSNRLDEIVLQMQNDETSIDEMIKLYEEGIHLSRDIEVYLKSAENKLKKITDIVKDN